MVEIYDEQPTVRIARKLGIDLDNLQKEQTLPTEGGHYKPL